GGESFPDDVMVGDEVMVTGSVFEIVPGGDGTGNLSTTQIVDNEVTVISSGNEVPETVLLGEGGRTIPTEVVISDDELPVNLQVDPGVFNPETDGIDFFESLEGMLVTVQDAQAVSPLNRFDEVQVVTDQGDGVTANGPDGGLSDRGALLPLFDADGLGDLNPERVQIAYDFDGPTAGLEVPEGINLGDVLGDITGVVDYSFGNFEVLVTESFEVEEASSITQETTALVTPDDGGSAGNELTVATYNVLNVTAATDTGDSDDDDADQIALLAQQIVENLGTPDIVALQEIQDDSGVSDGADDGVLSADETLQALVDAIVAAGGPRYEFESAIVDEAGETGGVPGGNIRNAFLWNADRVEATNIQTLEVEELTALGVTDPTAFDGTRDPLLGTFEFNGEEVTLINNHLSSRFGSTPIFGGPQPFVQAGEDARELETTTLNEVVDALLAEDAGAKIVVLGDLNTFEDTDELTEDLPGVGDEQVLTNLITGALDDDEAYTFNFEGSSQVLDHIFVTDSLVNGAEADIVHVNVDFAEAASDHEPVVARLLIEAEEDGETLIGNVFRNTIEGTNGDDTIEGRFGRDTLLGNGGDDTISGGRGRDEIDGGAGDDMLEGGGGRDTFLFTGLFGNDTILDANLRRDRLAFEGAEEDDLTIEMVGEDVVITVDDFEIAGTVTLIAPSNFDEDNLFFV
ncbi:MAG: endonuclease/exonuclease/phosphatase family protein, partial [Pseudomonadota bacterium]